MAGWIRVEADIHRHPKVVALPSPAARWAFLVILAEGKAVDGRWTSVRHFRACVPPPEARHLAAMIQVGLVAMDGDAVVIHDWSDYQFTRKDTTAAERMRRYRDRQRDGDGGSDPGESSRRNDERNAPVTSRAVSLSLSLSPSLPGEEDGYQVAPAPNPTPPEAHRLRELAEELTGQPNALANVWGGLGATAVRLARKHGIPAVEQEWRRIAADERGMPELRQLVFGADQALNRVATPRTETPAEREEREMDELRALAQRNLAAQGAPR